MYGVHTTQEQSEDTALLLRLGLPSTLIRHENGAFERPTLQTGGIKIASFSSSCGRDGKHFENELLEDDDVTIIA